MLKINNFQNFGGGISDYSAPDLEVLRVDVEQGFQMSTKTGAWDNSLNREATWGDELDF